MAQKLTTGPSHKPSGLISSDGRQVLEEHRLKWMDLKKEVAVGSEGLQGTSRPTMRSL